MISFFKSINFMLDTILSFVRSYADEAIVKNPDVPNEHNETAINTTAQTLLSSFMSEFQQGGISNLVGLFANGQNPLDSSIVKKIVSSLSSNLETNCNVDSSKSQGIAEQLIGKMFAGATQKNLGGDTGSNNESDSNNAFDLSKIMSALGGLKLP
jgi:hypothetical protein